MIKTIIQSTPKCADLLRYLRQNIDAINAAGYELSIEIASSERIDMLANNNINRLPVMIAPDKSLVVGVNEIINLIEKNITGGDQNQGQSKVGKQRRGKVPRSSMSVEDYLHDSIYDGVERTKSGLVAKQEQEYAEDDHFDYDKEKKKMSKHSMKHRSPLHDESDDDEPQKPAKKSTPVPKRLPPRRQPEYDSDEDNVDGGYDNEPLENYVQDTGDLDSKMMSALLNNM
jgi:hypothetical protein